MKKNRLFAQLLTTFAFIFSIATVPEGTMANDNLNYFCAQLHGIYRTFVNSARGRLMIISYVNSPLPLTNKQRCIIISQRFQAHSDNGNLQHIGTGYINNQPVLCAAINIGDPCRHNNILLTLTNGGNPTEEARQLLNAGFFATGRILELSGDEKLEIYRDGQTYYNLNLILEMAQPIEEEVILVD